MSKKEECIRLRQEERLSLRGVADRTGVPKGTLAGWLKPYPLSAAEKARKIAAGAAKRTGRLKARGEEARLHQLLGDRCLTRSQKAKVAEAAVLVRLCLFQFNPFGSVFDGDKTDWLVEVPESGQVVKIQVKWASAQKHGLPSIKMTCVDGHSTQRPYKAGEFDFLVGYDLYTDTCYVWTWEEVAHIRSTITITPDAAEAWVKLRH